MSTINIETVKQVCKNVKLQMDDNKLEKIFHDLKNLMNLAQKIDDINFDKNNINLQNFPFQNLNLLDEPLIAQEPVFQRPTINNMIVVPKFVNKDE